MAIAISLTSYLLPGVIVSGFWTAILVAAVLALLNALVKPVLVILTIPITIFTLGLFLLIINAVVVLMADAFVGDFQVQGLGWAILFSIIVSLINGLLQELAGTSDNQGRY